jgi:hypothetical protein
VQLNNLKLKLVGANTEHLPESTTLAGATPVDAPHLVESIRYRSWLMGPAPFCKRPVCVPRWPVRAVETPESRLQASLVNTRRELCSFVEDTKLPHRRNALCSAKSGEQSVERNGLQ